MIVFLSTADTDLLALEGARRQLGAQVPDVSAANPTWPGAAGNAVAALRRRPPGRAVVLLRLHGGRRACPEVVDTLAAACRARRVPLLALSADGSPDPELAALSSVPAALLAQVQAYLQHGGVSNLAALLCLLSNTFLGASLAVAPPQPQPEAGVYHPDLPDQAGSAVRRLAERAAGQGRPLVALLFYRAHWLSGNLAFVDALVRALERHGCEALPLFCQSLRLPAAPVDNGRAVATPAVAASRPSDGNGHEERPTSPPAHPLERYLLDARGAPRVDAVISTLSFAASRIAVPSAGGLDQAAEADEATATWLARLGVPVLQALVCTEPRATWLARAAGLRPLDVAMQVALPEFDGRIVTVPVCFKENGSGSGARPEGAEDARLPRYVPDLERCEALAAQAAAWAQLRRTPNDRKHVAIVLGNSPARNGRLGNGVGLDTPASLVALLQALRRAGYRVDDFPESSDALMHRLIQAGTYDPDFGMPEGAAGPPPGLLLGHVFIGIQPPRGWSDDPEAIYHDPHRPPPEAYVTFYRWLRAPPPRGFGAHAIIHLGKHGTLEWLPGKAVGLSAECAPDALLGDRPLIYPYLVSDPGEGTQAKRRAHAVLVGHLVPPLTDAGLHGDLAALERLLHEEREARTLDPAKLPLLRRRIWEAVRAAALDDDLGLAELPGDFDQLSMRLERYLHELQRATIRGGLHVLGHPPEGSRRAELLDALLRLAPPSEAARLRARLEVLLDRTTDELAAVLAALEGRYIPAGPSGSPARGAWNVLPTGRNFYSVDPQAIPSPAAWETGRRLAEEVLARHLAETGRYPQTVGLVVWGTAVMRTHGDDVAQALALLGVRPIWQPETGRVAGLAPIPLHELGRPRIDVTLHVSGFFRDAFPQLLALLDDAVQLVAGLDEPEAQNYVVGHVRHEAARLTRAGLDEREARRQASYRVFGNKPGCYGAGLLPLIEHRNWRTVEDLARAYETWSAYAYGRDTAGVPAGEAFRARFTAIEVAAKNQDNREHDLFDSDDYFQFHGGMVAAATVLRAKAGLPAPRAYFGDSADPRRPAVRSLHEEARRVFRSRVTNPKWVEAMRRHGYKGAFELAATVDYLFGYDATTGVVAGWMYERLAEAYVFDPQTREFLARSNPWALRDIAERLLEAAARGLWEQPAPETLERLRRIYLETEGDLEAGTGTQAHGTTSRAARAIGRREGQAAAGIGGVA